MRNAFAAVREKAAAAAAEAAAASREALKEARAAAKETAAETAVAARALRRDVDKVKDALVTKVKEAKEAQQHRRSESASNDAAAPAGASCHRIARSKRAC
jgi:ABC-type transporter Mla subunit MlaD